MNNEHAFVLELADETEVTLNSQEHDEAQWIDYNEAMQWGHILDQTGSIWP